MTRNNCQRSHAHDDIRSTECMLTTIITTSNTFYQTVHGFQVQCDAISGLYTLDFEGRRSLVIQSFEIDTCNNIDPRVCDALDMFQRHHSHTPFANGC